MSETLRETLERIASWDDRDMASAATLHYDFRGWARKALADNPKPASPWRPASEPPPLTIDGRFSQDVLVRAEDGPAIAYFNHRGQWREHGSYNGMPLDVTHWQPMPAPPGEES